MTRGEMKANIRYALGLREPEEQSSIDQAITDGIRDLLRRTSCYVQCIDADTPESDRLEIPGAGTIQKIVHVYRGGLRQERVTVPALDHFGAGVYAQTGQILIFRPGFSADEKLQLYAIPRPPAMDSDDDALEDEQWGGIPPEYQDGVEIYACSRLGSRSDDGTSGMGVQYWQMYVGADGRGGRANEIRREVNRMSGSTLGPAILDWRP